MTSLPVREAAAVILCRQPSDLEVFWVRRQPALAFLGGFHAFPGGRISREDDPEKPGLTGGPADLRLRLCAIRELHEETGIRLTDPAALIPAGRWITPPFSPARFDTTFYLAWAPEGANPVVDDGELAEGGWIRPEDALDFWATGKALLAPPTLYALRGLEAAALMASGNDLPVDLEASAEHLTGAPEAEGGDVTRIEMRPGLFLFPMQTRTLPPATHTNAFLIGGGGMILVDPGSADQNEIASLLAFIDRLGTEGRGVAEIWLTHHHPDHVGGVAAVAKALDVPVRAHPLTAERLAPALRVDGVLLDGFMRDLPGRPGWRLRVLHTPGHAPGHVSLFEEVSRSLIAGDMVAGSGFIMIDPPEGNMTAYLESLRRLAALEASVIFPSHGPPTAGASRRLNEYLEHRLDRERKVLESLSPKTDMTIDDLLPRVYADVEPALHRLASRSLLAHLEKLVSVGRVRGGRDRYRLVST
jgi:ribonuclease/clavin/mitogillin